MLCAIEELGLDHKYLKPEDIEGIAELGEDAVVGSDAIKYLEMDDEIIDFELTANRGDLLSILGMAYEIGAIYGKEVKDIDLSHKENSQNINDNFNLKIETENCPLFLAKRVENVVIKESPPADVPYLLREIKRIGNNINQILRIANANGFIDTPRLRSALDELSEANQLIYRTYAKER